MYLTANEQEHVAALLFQEDPRYMLNSLIKRIEAAAAKDEHDPRDLNIHVQISGNLGAKKCFVYLGCSEGQNGQRKINRAMILLPLIWEDEHDDLIRDRLFPDRKLVRRFHLAHELAHLSFGHYKRWETGLPENSTGGAPADLIKNALKKNLSRKEFDTQKTKANAFAVMVLVFHGRLKCRQNLRTFETVELLRDLAQADAGLQEICACFPEEAAEVWKRARKFFDRRLEEEKGGKRIKLKKASGNLSGHDIVGGGDINRTGVSLMLNGGNGLSLPITEGVKLTFSGECEIVDNGIVDKRNVDYNGLVSLRHHSMHKDGKVLLGLKFEEGGAVW